MLTEEPMGRRGLWAVVSQLWDLNRPLKSRLGNKGPVGHTLGAPVLCKRHGAPNCVFERLHIREDFFFFLFKKEWGQGGKGGGLRM